MSLLTLENIFKEYRGKTVLNGASLRVERGERVALTGPNGSGKTTLIRIALGLETPDNGNITIARGARTGYLSQALEEFSGCGRENDTDRALNPEVLMEITSEKITDESVQTAVHYEKVARLERKLRELEKSMASIMDGTGDAAYSEIFREYSRLLERYEALDGYSVEAKIKATLLGLGLKEEALTTPVVNLSGGEKMRVAVARLLLEQPDLLILDEPTNHLDIHAVEWLEDFLRRFDGGVLFVSHDRYFLDRVATRVAELEKGFIAERSGNYSTFVEQKEKMQEFALREQRRLQTEIEIAERKARSLKGEGSHRTRNISAWKSREKMVAKLRGELAENNSVFRNQSHLYKAASLRLALKEVKHVSAEIARAEGLKKSFGGSVLFSSVDFLIRGGERIGIIGDNGCGKTTLLNILLGKDKDFEGYARLGQWVRYSWLGQDIGFEDENRSILDEFMSRKDMQESEARDFLSGFQFYGDDLEKKLMVLSGGERVRLYLACIMLAEPDCLIMDEPTNHLDVNARKAVESALKKFKGTLIAISHDRYFLNECINRIYEFRDGTLYSYEGNYDFYRSVKQGPDDRNNADSDIAGGRDNAGKLVNKGRGFSNNDVNANTDGKVCRQNVEADIFNLEEQKKDLESSFGKDTSADAYREYNEVVQKLSALYGMWDELPEK